MSAGRRHAKPDARRFANPDPTRLRGLIEAAGLTQEQAAALVGVSARTMRRYLADPASTPLAQEAPYAVQFAVEHL